MSADPYAIPQADIPVPEFGTYVPRWYTPHNDLSLPVLDENGGWLGFSIGDVLPWRRWAVQESGQLLPQHLFEQRYKQWAERVLAPNGAIVEIKRFNKYFDVNLETVPGVDEFVDAKPDASMPTTNPALTRFVPIAYNPMAADKGRRKIRPLYTHTGERAEAKAAPEAPPEGFDAVAKVAKAAKVKAAEPVMLVPCGKTIKAKFLRNHKRLCKACGRLAAEAAQAQADAESTATPGATAA